MKNNRKFLIIFILSVVIACVYCYIKSYYSVNNKITENKHNNIKLNCNDFSKSFKKSKSITIENNTSNVKVYSLKWTDIENTLEYQDKFLYEIKCEGSNCKDISPSQIPAFDFTLFTDIYIEMHNKQKYTITFSYKGNKDEYGYFKGKLVVEEEIIDKQKYETYINERNKRVENMDKVIKEYQKLDDK